MEFTPKHINRCFSLDILTHLGIEIKSTLPDIRTCPLCSSDNSFVVDLDYAGGFWFRCVSPICNFSGGLVEFVAEKMQCTCSLAIQHLISIADTTNLRQLITSADIMAYDEYVSYTSKIKLFWKNAKSVSNWKIDSAACSFLQELKLWSNHASWPFNGGQFAGMAFRDTMKPIVGSVIAKSLFPRAADGSIVTAWEDVPGRIHAFELQNKRGSVSHVTLQNGEREEGGLMFLGSLPAKNELVYGIGHTLAGLYIQNASLQVKQALQPLVVWRGESKTSWQYVRAKCVVLWEPRISHRIFIQAKQIPNSLIAAWDLKPTETLTKRVLHLNIFLEKLQAFAKPWPAVLKDTLLGMSHAEACDMAALIQMTAKDWDMVFAACTPDERFRLNKYHVAGGFYRQTVFAGYRVIARNGCWYASKLLRAGETMEEMISDAPLTISTVLRHRPSKRTFFIGHIEHQGEKTPFEVEESILREDAAGYIRTLLTEKNKGYPVFSGPAYSKNFLVDVAVQLSRPELRCDEGHVGWDKPHQCFNLPHVSVSRAAIRETPTLLNVTELIPAASVSHMALSASDVQTWIRDDPTYCAFWALFAAALRNTLSRSFETVPSAVCVIGSRVTTGGEAHRAVRRVMGLLEVTMSDSEKLDELNAALESYDLPFIVSAHPDKLSCMEAWILDPGVKNSITLMTSRTAGAVSLYAGWEFVTAAKQEPTCRLPTFDGLFTNALFKSFDWKQMGVPLTTPFVLEQLKEWVIEKAELSTWRSSAADMFSHAAELLKIGSPWGPLSMVDRFLYLLFQLEDSIGFGRRPIYVEKDDEVRVFLRPLYMVMRKILLPLPSDYAELANWLEPIQLDRTSTDGSIIIRRDYWDQCKKSWGQPTANFSDNSAVLGA